MRAARGESGSSEGTAVPVAAPSSHGKTKAAGKPIYPAGDVLELGGGHEALVCADPASRSLVELLTRIAPSDVPVLISGESGTGKGLIARYLHAMSGRTGALLEVNCRAIAESGQGGPYAALIDSNENAQSNARWFDVAARGTLFLDEIGDLPLELQAKLLCALENRESKRAGASVSGVPDVRLVAATRLDLGSAVAAGRFRLDLLYRLNTAEVALLPLRERMGDVVALANHFIRTYAKDGNCAIPMLGADAREALTSYSWPGNVRELRNVIRFALLVAPAQELRREHLQLLGAPLATQQRPAPDVQKGGQELPSLSEVLERLFQAPGGRLLERVEGQVVEDAFRFSGGNQVRTAALLGISRNVLRTLLKKHGLYEVRAYSFSDHESGREKPPRRGEG
jgi:DNA-binding NtrC family response regulator